MTTAVPVAAPVLVVTVRAQDVADLPAAIAARVPTLLRRPHRLPTQLAKAPARLSSVSVALPPLAARPKENNDAATSTSQVPKGTEGP